MPNNRRRANLDGLNLSDDEKDQLIEDVKAYNKTNVNFEQLFELLQEWQSLRMRVLRRTSLIFSLLILGAAWVGVDFSELNFFGLSAADGNLERLYGLLLFVLIVIGGLYVASLKADLSIRKAKIDEISNDLRSALQIYEKWMHVVTEAPLSNVNTLFSKAYNRPNSKINQITKAVELYREKLINADYIRKTLDWFDILAPLILVIISIIYLISKLC